MSKKISTEKLYWIIEATHELRKSRGGYVAASTLFEGARDSLQLLKPFHPVLLGGFAVGVYAEPRATQDFDLTLLSEDFQGAQRALLQAGFVQTRITDFKGVYLYHFEREGFLLDILQFLNSQFQLELVKRSTPTQMWGEDLSVISLEDLIVTKLLSFRTRDQNDILLLLGANPAIDFERIKVALQDLKIFDLSN